MMESPSGSDEGSTSSNREDQMRVKIRLASHDQHMFFCFLFLSSTCKVVKACIKHLKVNEMEFIFLGNSIFTKFYSSFLLACDLTKFIAMLFRQ